MNPEGEWKVSVNNLDHKKTPQADEHDEDEDEVFLLEHIFLEKNNFVSYSMDSLSFVKTFSLLFIDISSVVQIYYHIFFSNFFKHNSKLSFSDSKHIVFSCESFHIESIKISGKDFLHDFE